MDDFIPVNAPLLNGNERKYLNECIDLGWISSEGPFFWSLNEQPVLKDLKDISRNRFPVSENISRNGFYIPSGLALTADEIDKVSDSLIAILQKHAL